MMSLLRLPARLAAALTLALVPSAAFAQAAPRNPGSGFLDPARPVVSMPQEANLVWRAPAEPTARRRALGRFVAQLAAAGTDLAPHIDTLTRRPSLPARLSWDALDAIKYRDEDAAVAAMPSGSGVRGCQMPKAARARLSATTRSGCFPGGGSRRAVSSGSSASTVSDPTMTASWLARRW